MGFTKPDFAAVDPDTFLEKPLMERMRILAVDWAEKGFGSPKMIHTIYIAKLVMFFAIGGITAARWGGGWALVSGIRLCGKRKRTHPLEGAPFMTPPSRVSSASSNHCSWCARSPDCGEKSGVTEVARSIFLIVSSVSDGSRSRNGAVGVR
jgi:hypothetical protein